MIYWKITTVTYSLDKKSLIISKLLVQNVNECFVRGNGWGKDEVSFDTFSNKKKSSDRNVHKLKYILSLFELTTERNSEFKNCNWKWARN